MNIIATSKTGKEIIIRRAEKKDAQEMIDYSNLIFESSDTTLTSSGEFNYTLKMEEEFIHNMHEKSDNSIILLAFHDDKLISLLGFHGSSYRKSKHCGFFGISVHPELRNEGIGRIMISTLLDWAKAHTFLERVELTAFSHNHNGLNLYQSLGFKIEGRKIKAGKLDSGEYVDMILMAQFV